MLYPKYRNIKNINYFEFHGAKTQNDATQPLQPTEGHERSKQKGNSLSTTQKSGERDFPAAPGKHRKLRSPVLCFWGFKHETRCSFSRSLVGPVGDLA